MTGVKSGLKWGVKTNVKPGVKIKWPKMVKNGQNLPSR